MDKGINNNGFEFVDLGLPSGTLWATMNVGASNPSDYGQYFQWGDTQGYTSDKVGIGEGKKKFVWDDYKWNPSGDGQTFTKYTTTGAALELEDDAAHANMGGDWHIPTPEQLRELLDNTTRKWVIQNDASGMKFTSKKDDSKSIFIPAAGVAWNGLIDDIGNYGYIWSSTVDAYFDDYGKVLYFISNGGYIDGYDREYGVCVRAVIDKKDYNSKEKGKK